MIALFLKYHDDRFILELVQDILKLLSQNPYCHQSLQEKIVPTLVSILNSQGEKENASMQDIALDVLETIVKYSKPPLSNVLENAFQATVHCILSTEDHSVMQSGNYYEYVILLKIHFLILNCFTQVENVCELFSQCHPNKYALIKMVRV